jgi:endonuclease/exonuclease/phosphatase family metal-dependent hydrolase
MSGPLTVTTFNLCSGRSPYGTIEAHRLGKAIRALDGDVLAVQEVDRGQPRSEGVDQIEVVAEAFGAVSARMAPTLCGEPGPASNWRPTSPEDEAEQGPLYGVGLVSRLPVLAWRTCYLGGSRAVLPFPVPRPGRRLPGLLLVPDEPRVALAAVVDTPSGPVTVISTHLSFAPPVAARQLRRIIRWSESLPGPRVLAGDLNLPGSVPARLTGWRGLIRARTYPADRPRLQLDHLLTDAYWAEQDETLHAEAERSAVGRGGHGQLAVSDHRPIRATLHDLHPIPASAPRSGFRA